LYRGHGTPAIGTSAEGATIDASCSAVVMSSG
jgi:hypothetical protein